MECSESNDRDSSHPEGALSHHGKGTEADSAAGSKGTRVAGKGRG